MTVKYYDTNGGGLDNTEIDANFRTVNWIKGDEQTAAATLTLPSKANYFVVTGNTSITAIDNVDGGDGVYGYMVRLKFSGSPILSHGTGFQLMFSDHMQMAPGDVATFVNESNGVYRMTGYMPASTMGDIVAGDIDATSYSAGTILSGVKGITVSAGDNSTNIATTAYADTAGGSNTNLVKCKAANEVVNNSTSLQNDDDFVWLNIAEGKYKFEMYLYVTTSGGTPGIKWEFDTTGIDSNDLHTETLTGVNGIGLISSYINSFSQTSLHAITTSTYSAHIVGQFQTNSATNSLIFQWAQNTAQGVDLTLKEGSWMSLSIENA